MSIGQFLRILIARRLIILGTLVTCVLVAAMVAATLPPRYPAKARVLLDFRPDPVTGAALGRDPRAYISTQMELIQDYRIAGDTVDRLGWQNNPGVVAAWQAETGGQSDFRRWGAQRIINSTNVALVQGSNILEIVYESPDPEVAKQVVSALREAYVENSLRFKTDSAGRTAEWYREQSDKAQAALTAAETAMAKFEQDNGIVVTAGGEAESGKLAALQSALMAARTGATSTQSAVASMTGNSGIVDQLKVQQAALDDQIEQAGERLGIEHPTYKALLARRKLVLSEIARETAVTRAAGAAASGSSQRTVTQLAADYEAQRLKVLGMKDNLNKLAQLQREVELRRGQYEKAAARTADLKLESNSSESGLVILGDAIGAAKPSFPNWSQILSLAFAFGLGLGVVVGLFAELMRRRIRGTEDLGFASRAPVFAVIADAAPSPWRDRARRLLSRRRPDAAWQPAQ